MKYYNQITTKDNLILSCDMLRLTFNLDKFLFNEFNQYINYLSMKDSKYYFTMFENNSLFAYKYLLKFSYQESTIVIGLLFNGAKNNDKTSCFIEFNPNKTLALGFGNEILNWLKTRSRHLELSRFDLAIDIPVKRSLISFSKDKRKYNKVYAVDKAGANIENLTEYLGRRNHNGFCKLYNKTLESNLDYSLSRLELTLDTFDYDNFVKELPNTYFIKTFCFYDTLNLNDTDRVLLNLLMQVDNPNIYIGMLGRGKREKFRQFLYDCNYKVNVCDIDYYNLCSMIKKIYE